MKYRDLIAAILNTPNGAIKTLNNVFYQNIHKTVREYAKVNAKTAYAQLHKEQMIDLYDSIKSSKCRLQAVDSKKK